ncbi:MAG: response regulator receiver protein [Promethearchaeota archaeon CR_4]|nr:MAG: response regulator receiver protein [Candidatus Lokiarchaeota archaeon CR_4]
MSSEPSCDIIVVDDEPDTLRLAQKILEMENFTVKTAVNGEDALQLIKKRGVIPRLMLLDIMMPKSDGWTVLETLKKDEKYKKIKIVLFTVKAFTKDIDRAKALGADGYITKPFSGDKLIENIRERLKS